MKHIRVALALFLSLLSSEPALSAIQQSTISLDGHDWRALAHDISTGTQVVVVPAEPNWTPTDAQALLVATKYATEKNCHVGKERIAYTGHRWLFNLDCPTRK